MILPCPACRARFMVPDDRITPKGIKIRCPKCRFVFIMRAQRQPGRATDSAGAATAVASGSIGGAAAARPKRKRRAPEEVEAEKLSPEELAALAGEEIVDMDDLAQPTEQSGTAYNPNIREEHLRPQAQSGPSVLIDDSLLAAAAEHKASWTEEPTAPEHIPRIDPSLTVADTWVDLPGEPAPAAAAVPDRSAPPEGVERVTARTEPPLSAADHAALAEDASAPAGEAPAGEAPAAAGEQSPSSPAAAPGPSVLGSVLPPAAEADEFDVDLEDLDEAPPAPAAAPPAAPQAFHLAYTLTAATSLGADELAALEEWEGLLVEEKKALRKGPAATVIAVVGIVLGLLVLGTLGYLGWEALNPPEKKPPSWGHLQLFDFDHDVVKAQAKGGAIRVRVRVRNASTDARFEHVHVLARLVSPTGQTKCENYAPCGPVLSDEELRGVSPRSYHEAVAQKARGTPYNVQLNPGQSERCQVLLFCADRYRVGVDKVRVEIDKQRSKRLME